MSTPRSTFDIIHQMQRQFVEWPSTFGPCDNDCGRPARGGGQCLHCLTEELAIKTDKPLEANRLARAMAEVRDLKIALREAAKETGDDDVDGYPKGEE